jgi:polyisoprenoid-binding protein YceI
VFALVLAGFTVPARAAVDTWEINPIASAVHFSVRHLMVSTVRGEFSKIGGTVEYDGRDFRTVKATATIDAASINTRVAPRDKDLKSERFLNVEKYPTITFASRRAEPIDAGSFRLIGDLTLHGVTKEVVLLVEAPSPPIVDKGSLVTGTTATTKINRFDFNLRYNERFDGGGAVVGDDITITIDLELKRPAPPGKTG